MQSESKICKECKANFVIESDDFGFYEKMDVPVPTLCPKCRRTRRLVWLNYFNLYSRECFLCKKKMLSIYHPDYKFKVLCPKCFHGDGWDPYSFGVDYIETKSFIEQVVDLYKNTPALGIINDNDIASINCTYTNDVAFSKNCSMTFIAWKLENVIYSCKIASCNDICDCLCISEGTSFTYEGVFSDFCSYCRDIYWSSNCVDCNFAYDLRGCTDCFMCSGLRNKSHCFKNKQYSKEEYEKIISVYDLSKRSAYLKAKEEFRDFLKDKPRKFAELKNCVGCTGTDMLRSKNIKSSAMAYFSEDSKYVFDGINFKSCYDCAGGGECELAYDSITPDQSYGSLCTINSWKGKDVFYSINCHGCSNIFGCVSLKKGEYSILNKRYSKEEYEKLFEKIKEDMKKRGEWGEFFSAKFSPFGINETRAIEQLELTREEALGKGYKWQDNLEQTRGKETIMQDDVPDSIFDVEDKITEEVLACVKCARNYKILPQELLFYRRMKIPIPQKCFFCRHSEREAMRPGFDLSERQCDCMDVEHGHNNRCAETFETFFTNKEKRSIYCEKCYQNILN